MVTFFQTITGLIGQRVDGSQQGGGGGDNPNPPLVNDPQISIYSNDLKYQLDELTDGSEIEYILYLKDMRSTVTGLQDPNVNYKFTINSTATDPFIKYSNLSYEHTYLIDEVIYNSLKNSAAAITLTVEIISNNTAIATSNTLTYTLEA